ncbi:MAG: hypothetical protein JNL05_06425 [Flavobacteriales bacterium]|nr:hypothetical protein [Flavobacteriales bacterium]
MKQLLTLFLLGLTLHTAAQTEVTFSSRKFSTGLQPTFTARFTGAERAEVEAWFKRSLKDISADVRDKKEVLAIGARIPAATGDTLSILLAVDQRSKNDDVVAHLAFRIAGDFVNSDSEQRRIDGCKAFVYDQAVAYKRKVASERLEEAERDLRGAQGKLEEMQRDQKRYELGIEKNNERSADAAKDKEKAVEDLKLADVRVKEMEGASASNPTEEQIKALNSALKEQKKLQERITKLDTDGVDARLKVSDLQKQLADNAKAQESQRQAVAAQEQVVEERRKALAEIK